MIKREEEMARKGEPLEIVNVDHMMIRENTLVR